MDPEPSSRWKSLAAVLALLSHSWKVLSLSLPKGSVLHVPTTTELTLGL
jgi:hypothetical protein